MDSNENIPQQEEVTKDASQVPTEITPVESANDTTATTATTTASTASNVTEPPLLPHLQQAQQQVSQASPDVNYEQEAKKLEDKALRFLAKQTHPVIIPSFSKWFDLSKIHEIEKKSLPDFFDDSSRFKTPKAYKDTRNFIINTYRLSPYEYLTMTAVRRNVAMDVASIVKIHAFLEKWGLINYQIDPRSKPSLIGPSFTGHFQLTLDTPQGLKPFVPSTLVKSQPQENATGSTTSNTETTEPTFIKPNKFPVNLSLRSNVYESVNDFNALKSRDKTSRQINKTYVCHTCGNDTVLIRFHNLRAKDANLCSRCFQEGHFGANFQASDFIKLENNPSVFKTNWSDQDVLLLLEGIEMYEDQWEKIANHIGNNKTVEDCVQKFLTLPIEDQFINDIMGPQKTKNKQINNDTISNTAEAVDATIKALLDGLNKKVLEESIPESSKLIAEKYLQETQIIIQETVNLTLQKLNQKFEKLDKLEQIVDKEKLIYIKESEKLLNDRISLSTQISELNKELEQLNISKKIVLLSEQVDQSIKLMEKDTNTSENNADEQLKKASEMETEPISKLEPQLYKQWSL
ncbi:hypothetical protein TBLA_0D04700 [Henningerozyma blattae CBS 6284]|uniref:SWIRM domain-containing protein n=1 Tax=Henningerozyma blattae (strain ATCC 34711 / CBS 6284 / DSM 70876 / NBRC 10599 / NRRL Y-10934 / UCD 77-7) TaxID=1071380 RepID=I2H3L4_HENB6|nr:hypothetical protein TBLA_0D04700 [Tetrapisispora blattae CBS 6284]CCH60966.1 hypothetical protein TBLA_0D04700 [Tetrapisispora blattae CBS 6284]